MRASARSYARRAVNSSLSLLGFELVRRNRGNDEFIPFKKTLKAAAKAGLSVGDYIDVTYNLPGVTLDTIERITEMRVLRNKIERVCEIGPGSGRYLEKIQKTMTLYTTRYTKRQLAGEIG